MLSIHVLRPCHTVQFFLQLATQLATLDVKLANTPFHHSLLIVVINHQTTSKSTRVTLTAWTPRKTLQVNPRM